MSKISKMSKRNTYRALLSEFLPSGTDSLLPFTNDIFYKYITNQIVCSDQMSDLVGKFIEDSKKYYCEDNGYTIPYAFFIRKNDYENRELKIIHPVLQLSFVSLYDKYGNYIAGACSKSQFSIRCPKNISSSLHLKNAINNEEDDHDISLSETDKRFKYYKSFFSYSGYTKLYHFYNSKKWLNYEKKFNLLLRVDINSCFPSIYTHSMSWALTSKLYAKETSHKAGNLWNDFDILMRRSNYNETNGIPIGPESSRVFAELILQRIDKSLEAELEECKSTFSNNNFKVGENYSIARYVDDYFIYANNEDDLNLIQSKLSHKLKEYNLSLNKSKTELIARPFQISKSSAISCINNLFDKLVEDCEGDRYDDYFSSFLVKIKSIVLNHGLTYLDVSSYLHGALDRRLNYRKKSNRIKIFKKENFNNFKFIKNTIDLVFFFYNVSLTGSSGAKVAKLLFRLRSDLKRLSVDYTNLIDQLIVEEIELVLTSYLNSIGRNNVLPVEIFNLLIVASKIKKDTENFISEKLLCELFEASSQSYFELVAFQYYIKNNNQYKKLQKRIVAKLREKLHNAEKKSTEQFLLAFDFAACPYLSINFREEILTKICSNYNILNHNDIKIILQDIGLSGLFICWDDLQLNKILQKKILMDSY